MTKEEFFEELDSTKDFPMTVAVLKRVYDLKMESGLKWKLFEIFSDAVMPLETSLILAKREHEELVEVHNETIKRMNEHIVIFNERLDKLEAGNGK